MNTMEKSTAVKTLSDLLGKALQKWKTNSDQSTTMLLHCLEHILAEVPDLEDVDYVQFVNYVVDEQYNLKIPLSSNRTTNLVAIKRYIQSYCWFRSVLFPKGVDVITPVTVEQIKEGFFFLTALQAMSKLEGTDYEQTIKRTRDRLVVLIKDGLNRKKQLELIDHIQTDPTYTDEFKTELTAMLVKKTTTPPGRKAASKKTTSADTTKAAEQTSRAATGSTVMTPFLKRQAEREAAEKAAMEAAAKPALTLEQVTTGKPRMLSMPATTAWPLPDAPDPKKWCDGHRYLQENPKGGDPIVLSEKAPECGYKVSEDEDMREKQRPVATADAKAQALELLSSPDILAPRILLFFAHVDQHVKEAIQLMDQYVASPETDLEDWKGLTNAINDIAPWLETFTRPYDQQMINKKPPEPTEKEKLLTEVLSFGQTLKGMVEQFNILTAKLEK